MLSGLFVWARFLFLQAVVSVWHAGMPLRMLYGELVGLYCAGGPELHKLGF